MVLMIEVLLENIKFTLIYFTSSRLALLEIIEIKQLLYAINNDSNIASHTPNI